MAEETITILKVGTEEAVKSIADLKQNIKFLKEGFEDATGTMHKGIQDLEIGTQEYQDALEELKVNQNALKDAMYATSSSMEDVSKSATGASESYNSLVHRMAALKEEFRSTNDAARRATIGTEIRQINDELKKMDALQGNFQRNVGNYRSVISGLGDGLDAFRKGLGAATKGIGGMKDGCEALAKSPAVATFSILVSLVMKLADAVKDDEKATAALKKGMDALQPVMDFLSGILDKVVDFLVEIINKVSSFLGSSGIINQIIKGVMGVGNAILQFVIAPFKGIVEAIKVFKEQGVKGLGNAAKAFGQEMKSGVSFKENFKSGQVAADTILSGVSSRSKKAKDTGKKMGKDIREGLLKEMEKNSKKMEERQRKEDEAFAKSEKKFWEDFNKDMDKQAEDDFKETMTSISADTEDFLQDQIRQYQEEYEKQKEIAKAKKDLLKGVASATSDILGVIADLYEEDEENAEKNANRIKALRIAAATIDTISGAIGAFMQATETVPPPYGQILGAIEAAAITATGVANIAKMKSTNVTGDGGTQRPTLTTASAPTLQTNVANVRTVTSSSEEDRLNRMAGDQRVYILASDIQASQNQIKTQVSESSF